MNDESSVELRLKFEFFFKSTVIILLAGSHGEMNYQEISEAQNGVNFVDNVDQTVANVNEFSRLVDSKTKLTDEEKKYKIPTPESDIFQHSLSLSTVPPNIKKDNIPKPEIKETQTFIDQSTGSQSEEAPIVTAFNSHEIKFLKNLKSSAFGSHEVTVKKSERPVEPNSNYEHNLNGKIGKFESWQSEAGFGGVLIFSCFESLENF